MTACRTRGVFRPGSGRVTLTDPPAPRRRPTRVPSPGPGSAVSAGPRAFFDLAPCTNGRSARYSG